MAWCGSDPKKLRELRENLVKMKTLVQAQKIKEIEKLEKALEVFDLQTQDEIRKAANATVD